MKPSITETETYGALVLLDSHGREVSTRIGATLLVRTMPTADGRVAIQCQPKRSVALVPRKRAAALGYLLGGVLIAATPHKLLPTAKRGQVCRFTFDDVWTDEELVAMAAKVAT